MLKPSKKLALALEAVVDIAYYGGSEPVQSQGIAERLKLPRRYLEQVMQQLVRAGVLKGVRGPRGGYRLAKERRRVTVGEVIRVVEGINGSDEVAFISDSVLGTEVMSDLWENLSAAMVKRLDSVTIEDLCAMANKKNIASTPIEQTSNADFVI